MGILEDQFMSILWQQQAGQLLQNCQPGCSQRQLAQAQQQACMAQQQGNYASLYGKSLAQYAQWRPTNVFIPLTQDEVDMAEAVYEVNKIAPGLKEEGI